MTICYFTASGNSLYVARQIGGTLLSIPQLMRQDKIELHDDAVGIVSPCYAVEMPMMVRDFIARADIRTDYFFFIYTYGMGYAEAFAHVKLAAERKGLKLSYINAIQMVDNYLPVFDQQEQIDTLPQKNVDGQIARMVSDIGCHHLTPMEVTDAQMDTIALYRVQLGDPILRKDTARSYIVTEACIHCGICAKVCPANNITVSRNEVLFDDRCEVCYACLHNCPQQAIYLKKEAGTTRYRNEHVTLKDIIDANK